MRSVQLFPSMDRSQLSTLLNSLGKRRGSEWFGVADRALEVTLTDYNSAEALVRAVEAEGSWTVEEVRSLESVRGDLGGCWVELRVSGRVDGQAEMLDVIRVLLAAGGHASDDYSQGLWSLDDIERGRRVSGERFRA